MGQAKRRKEQLGELYGTPEGSNDYIDIRFMTPEEIEEADGFGFDVNDKSTQFLLCTRPAGTTPAPVVVLPFLNPDKSLSSHVYILSPKDSDSRVSEIAGNERLHSKVNRFILDNIDVVVSRA